MNNIKSSIFRNIKVLFLGLLLALGITYVSAAGTWTAPTATAPGGNVDAPVNVGATAQIKEGTLTLGGLGVVGNFTYLPAVGSTVTPGQVLVAQNSSGKVGWVSTSSLGISGTNSPLGYEIKCLVDQDSDGHGGVFNTPTCLRLNKSTGQITTQTKADIAFFGASVFADGMNVPIAVFGTAPYSMIFDSYKDGDSSLATDDSIICLVDGSGKTSCIEGGIDSITTFGNWSPLAGPFDN